MHSPRPKQLHLWQGGAPHNVPPKRGRMTLTPVRAPWQGGEFVGMHPTVSLQTKEVVELKCWMIRKAQRLDSFNHLHHNAQCKHTRVVKVEESLSNDNPSVLALRFVMQVIETAQPLCLLIIQHPTPQFPLFAGRQWRAYLQNSPPSQGARTIVKVVLLHFERTLSKAPPCQRCICSGRGEFMLHEPWVQPSFG